MRKNFPVTQTEQVLKAGEYIVSKTDLKGRITYVNRPFLDISGFSEAELIGQPHNIVRHPDMPPAAFDDLWRTLKRGESWRGMVKNRCKNGDFYWVEANANPIWESGRVTGYMSLRVAPSRAQIDAAEALYKALREGRAGPVRVERGQVVRAGPLGVLARLGRISLQRRYTLAVGLLMLGSAVLGAGALDWLGLAPASAITINAAMLVLGAWTLFSLRGQVFAAIDSLVQRCQVVAAGDLRLQRTAPRGDEFGELDHALMTMTGNLSSLIADVDRAARELDDVATGLSQQGAALGSATSEQAASLEETSSALASIAESIKQTSERTAATDAKALHAADATGQCGEAVGGTLTAMNQIAEKIKLIDDIAYGTNLVALNAAIEAARAGEHGRSFAVVATEVRRLAEQARSTADEVRQLADRCVGVAQNSQTMIADIVPEIRDTSRLVQEISQASRDQAGSVGEVDQAMKQVTIATERNAETVNRLAAMVDSVQGQAGRMARLVGFFRT